MGVSYERQKKAKPKGRRNALRAPWIGHPLELLRSPAYRSLGINARRCLDRIEIEHLAHAGKENGNLIVTYDDFVAYGATRECVRAALQELEDAGLIEITQQGGLARGERHPNKYRLTFEPDRERSPRTDEWEKITAEQIVERAQSRRELESRRRSNKEGRRLAASPETSSRSYLPETSPPAPDIESSSGSGTGAAGSLDAIEIAQPSTGVRVSEPVSPVGRTHSTERCKRGDAGLKPHC